MLTIIVIFLYNCHSQEQTSLLQEFDCESQLSSFVTDRTVCVIFPIFISIKSHLLCLPFLKISKETLLVGLGPPPDCTHIQRSETTAIKTRWDLTVVCLLQKWIKIDGASQADE
jgi:hypothetical protein